MAPFIARAFNCSTVQVGCNWRNRAIMPAICGAAIEVPDIVSDCPPARKPVEFGVRHPLEGEVPVQVIPVCDDEMLTPGAVMSGFNCAGIVPSRGPRDEKLPMVSVGPKIVTFSEAKFAFR